MTDEALLPFGDPSPEAAITTARPRRHRHVYTVKVDMGPDGPETRFVCLCGAIQDPAASRRGRTVRNYGNRAELAVAKTYGGRKVGHAQGPTDVVGKTRKVQVKTARRRPPAMWRNEFAKLDSERDGRLAILLLRFIQPGNLGPDDYIVIRGKDFIEWYGRDDAD